MQPKNLFAHNCTVRLSKLVPREYWGTLLLVENDFQIQFWGVRGSIPVPGAATVEVGGNTSCVSMRCGKDLLVFDSGTGIRLLGDSLASKEEPLRLHLFISHVHWDHIQGFPFFRPAFVSGNEIHLYGNANSRGTVEQAMAGQMENPNFPVRLDQMGAQMHFHEFCGKDSVSLPGGTVVRAESGNHPGGVLAFRVEYGHRSAVYATDTEADHGPTDRRLTALSQGTDFFIFDSMYTPEEYDGRHDGRSRKGWGHSTFEDGARIAKAAKAATYVLFHHDPAQSDEDVRKKEERARAIFPDSIAAREGLILSV